jgi:aspartyl-tRNA(Asn)/glutamyl-tRNA(Gln) amidotransferase subunit C
MPNPRDEAEELVRRTAALARVEIPEHERSAHAAQFARILEAFRGLAELDVEGVEPLYSPAALGDVEREDRERASLPRAALLGNAPQAVEGFFGVPKTVGGAP